MNEQQLRVNLEYLAKMWEEIAAKNEKELESYPDDQFPRAAALTKGFMMAHKFHAKILRGLLEQ